MVDVTMQPRRVFNVGGQPRGVDTHRPRLATDPQALATIRSGLRAELRASPLMDNAGFIRELEALYRQAWEQGRE